jgi:glycerophosphoryl diester phosphodiesterase
MLSATLLLLVASAAAQSVQVHGHRGAAALLPENTLPAFEYAIAAGVDALELDLGVTKDGELVVSHDSVLHAPVCKAPKDSAETAVIHQLTLAEVKRWECGTTPNPAFPRMKPVSGNRMPTLDEVFALAPRGKFLFNIETKISIGQPDRAPSPEEFVRLVLAKIRKHHLESRVILQSFDFRTLAVMKKLAPEIKLSALCRGPGLDLVKIGKETGAQIVSPMHAMVTKEQIAAAHAAGLQVVPWTADTVKDWDRLIAAGADAIITNDPAALIAHRKLLSR